MNDASAYEEWKITNAILRRQGIPQDTTIVPKM